MSGLNKFHTGLLLLVIQCFLLPFNPVVLSAAFIFPEAIIELPENENAIIVEKETQTLFLYTNKADKLLVEFYSPCSTGEVKGIKLKAGDKKTPEGIYFLNDEYEDKYLSPIYGKKAFPTDYPNFIDQKAGKNGSAIWIHGTNKKLKPMDSNGCIALENFNILKLTSYINLDSTPVIMVPTINTADKYKIIKQKNDINNMLLQWALSLEKGSYHDYLSFYSSKYLPGIAWWENWRELRQNKNADNLDFALKINIDNVGIYFHDQVFVALFDYYLTVENQKILLGKRKFFLEYQKHGYKIIGDVFQKKSERFKKEEYPLITGARIFIKSDKKDLILDTIHQWLAAWSTKDIKTYALFYAQDFYSDGLNKQEWVKRKQVLAKKYNFINVSGRQFEIKFRKQMCEVVFFQEYESSGFTTQGTKKLKFVNKGGIWKIYQESWKEK